MKSFLEISAFVSTFRAKIFDKHVSTYMYLISFVAQNVKNTQDMRAYISKRYAQFLILFRNSCLQSDISCGNRKKKKIQVPNRAYRDTFEMCTL
jgi:hypothetical protein